MNNELEWTQKLGDAFLIQEKQVMATVQNLREKAYTAGNLKNQEHLRVERKEKVIVIEPARPEVIYVPVYDTRVVYGGLVVAFISAGALAIPDGLSPSFVVLLGRRCASGTELLFFNVLLAT